MKKELLSPYKETALSPYKGKMASDKKTDNPSGTAASFMWATMSCLMYCFCSVGMVLSNKAVSISIEPEVRKQLPQMTVILYQNVIAVVLVEAARCFKLVEYPNFSFVTARSWLPLNILFVGMLCSGFLSLVYVSVPMVTIFKNVTNLVTVFGDWYLFGESMSALTVCAVLVMTFGAVMAGANDLEFNLVGYVWMTINCACTAGYTLYMRYASTNIKLPKFGMVFYNNFLSIFFLIPLCIIGGEFRSLTNEKIMTPYFIVMNTAAGLLGFYLNFASLWCVSATSATTYAIVGSLNKIPVTVLGFVWFSAKITQEGIIFISLAMLGGFMYAYAKLPSRK